jgi:hypothetical protein
VVTNQTNEDCIFSALSVVLDWSRYANRGDLTVFVHDSLRVLPLKQPRETQHSSFFTYYLQNLIVF